MNLQTPRSCRAARAPAYPPTACGENGRRSPAPPRRMVVQLWLAGRAWGRIILHTWCLLFHHGKFAAARSGVARGIQDTRTTVVQWVFKNRRL